MLTQKLLFETHLWCFSYQDLNILLFDNSIFNGSIKGYFNLRGQKAQYLQYKFVGIPFYDLNHDYNYLVDSAYSYFKCFWKVCLYNQTLQKNLSVKIHSTDSTVQLQTAHNFKTHIAMLDVTPQITICFLFNRSMKC